MSARFLNRARGIPVPAESLRKTKLPGPLTLELISGLRFTATIVAFAGTTGLGGRGGSGGCGRGGCGPGLGGFGGFLSPTHFPPESHPQDDPHWIHSP